MLLARHSDVSCRGNTQDLIMQWIVRCRWIANVWTVRRTVDLGRASHVERFVRTFVIEGRDERVEAFLLLEKIGGWRSRGLCLERSVHPLVAAVLLGARGL